MLRFLTQIPANGFKAVEFMDAIEPLLKLLCLTTFGLVLGRVQIIPKETFKLLSKLIFVLFLPCLIFTNLGKSMNLKNITLWWFIPVNVLISTFVGGLLGILVVIVCRPPPEFKRFTIIMTAFGNTGNLPLAIVKTVCHSDDDLFGDECLQNGVAYVSFSQWVAVILVYTLVYHMMEPPLEYYEIEIVDEGEKEEQQPQQEEESNLNKPLIMEAEWPDIENKETEHSKTPFIARMFNSFIDDPPSNSFGCFAAPRVVRKMKIVAEQTPVHHILQPPTIASLLAIIVGLIPQVKAFMFGYDAPLSVITDSFSILAGAMVPSVMLILGGMLAEGPNDSRLGRPTMIGITVARLLILPLLGIGIVTLADKLHLLVAGDQMYKFVLLLQYSTPSAILLGAIASLRGYAVSESSALLFWQHLFALISLTLYLIIYFKLVLFL
ncbi:hypothetical protein LIER_11071 [Lithospermum erythrorhizon]|uniref:Uncharacterized protein n=1 Tax=Lithospermum erythrorhizon TaxID=34254 RepID=A0AAV3PP07_LITER